MDVFHGHISEALKCITDAPLYIFLLPKLEPCWLLHMRDVLVDGSFSVPFVYAPHLSSI